MLAPLPAAANVKSREASPFRSTNNVRSNTGAALPPVQRFAGTIRSRIVRTPFYLFSAVLLFISTLLILVALFTNNWQKTASRLVDKVSVEYFTYGLWFTCRHVNAKWITDHSADVYCARSNYNSSMLYACFVIIFENIVPKAFEKIYMTILSPLL
jgi:hypothetical protein